MSLERLLEVVGTSGKEGNQGKGSWPLAQLGHQTKDSIFKYTWRSKVPTFIHLALSGEFIRERCPSASI